MTCLSRLRNDGVIARLKQNPFPVPWLPEDEVQASVAFIIDPDVLLQSSASRVVIGQIDPGSNLGFTYSWLMTWASYFIKCNVVVKRMDS